MRTIMVLNSKGGSGKSVISTNLASYFAAMGQRVALVDFDQQASSLEWLAMRGSGHQPILGVDASKDYFRIPRNVDYVVYDTPAAIYGEALSAILRRAQTIIVPVLPSPIDMRAVTPFIQAVLVNNRVARKKCRVGLVANRCRENTKVYHTLDRYLRKVRKAPLLSALRETQNYHAAAARGLGIFDLAPHRVRRDREQWEPIIKWLKSARSMPSSRY